MSTTIGYPISIARPENTVPLYEPSRLYLEICMHIQHLMENEAMTLKEIKERYMGRFGRRKGRKEM